MSHAIAIPEELYTRLQALANERGQTTDALVADLLRDVVESPPDPADEAALRNSPFFLAAGMLEGDIEPGWLDRHDEIIAEDALDPHTEEK